jgi:hypothetical protein
MECPTCQCEGVDPDTNKRCSQCLGLGVVCDYCEESLCKQSKSVCDKCKEIEEQDKAI